MLKFFTLLIIMTSINASHPVDFQDEDEINEMPHTPSQSQTLLPPQLVLVVVEKELLLFGMFLKRLVTKQDVNFIGKCSHINLVVVLVHSQDI